MYSMAGALVSVIYLGTLLHFCRTSEFEGVALLALVAISVVAALVAGVAWPLSIIVLACYVAVTALR
jgi:hypothetical protein